MRKIAAIAMCVLILSLLAGCASGSASTRMPSKTDYSGQLDINSPEGLAKASSDLYMKMINGETTPEDGFQTLYGMCTEGSRAAMDQYKKEFIDSINQTKEYLDTQGDKISRYDFAETAYTDNSNASIERIQVQKSGKNYYFKQEFTMENGAWKIKGDNITDKFTIKQKFLFWYI